MIRKILIAQIVLLSLLSAGCHKQNKINNEKHKLNTITVNMAAAPTHLFYSGTLSPIQVFNVISPTDGAVKELRFKYGDITKKGQLLMVVGSSKLQEDYRTALTNFLKAKEDYSTGETNFKGTQQLLKAQIISTQEYLQEKQQYDSTVIAYLNAKYQLEQQLKKLSGSTELENLTLDNIDVLNKVLQMHYNDINIYAQNDGIILYPQKSSSSDSSDSNSDKPLQIGTQVKDGQILLGVGDLTGITTTVPVSELIIDRIKTGLDVTVTLEAIPNSSLKGVVTLVGAQAQAAPGGQGGLATFPVTVSVAKLPENIAKLVRVGMSTKVEITYNVGDRIQVPIDAVMQKNGQNMVTVLDPKTHKTREVPVTTGHTTATEVTVIKGLNPGDQVVIP